MRGAPNPGQNRSLSVDAVRLSRELLSSEGDTIGLNWPRAYSSNDDIPEPERASLRAVMDQFGDVLQAELVALQLPPYASPFFRPFSLIAVRERAQILVGVSPAAGMPQILWLDLPTQVHAPSALVDFMRDQ